MIYISHERALALTIESSKMEQTVTNTDNMSVPLFMILVEFII